jgi:hypothetical protein
MLPQNLLCFSPCNWDAGLFRPHQLMLRFAKEHNVYYLEEPVFDSEDFPFITFHTRSETLWKVVPHLPPGLGIAEQQEALEQLLKILFKSSASDSWMFWHCVPLYQDFIGLFQPKLVVYDKVPAIQNYRATNWDAIYKKVMLQLVGELNHSAAIRLNY